MTKRMCVIREKVQDMITFWISKSLSIQPHFLWQYICSKDYVTRPVIQYITKYRFPSTYNCSRIWLLAGKAALALTIFFCLIENIKMSFIVVLFTRHTKAKAQYLPVKMSIWVLLVMVSIPSQSTDCMSFYITFSVIQNGKRLDCRLFPVILVHIKAGGGGAMFKRSGVSGE